MIKINITARDSATQNAPFRVYSDYEVEIKGTFDTDATYSVGVYDPTDLDTLIGTWTEDTLTETKLTGTLSFDTSEAAAYVTTARKELFLYVHNVTDNVDVLSYTTSLYPAPDVLGGEQASANSTVLSGLRALDTDLAAASEGDIFTVDSDGNLVLTANPGDVAASITAAAAVTAPTDAGVFGVIIGGVLKKITWANIVSTIQTALASVFAPKSTNAGTVNVTGAATPALTPNSVFVLTYTGDTTRITPTGLADGQGCHFRVSNSGGYSGPTTGNGLTEETSGGMADIATDGAAGYIYRDGSTYYCGSAS